MDLISMIWKKLCYYEVKILIFLHWCISLFLSKRTEEENIKNEKIIILIIISIQVYYLTNNTLTLHQSKDSLKKSQYYDRLKEDLQEYKYNYLDYHSRALILINSLKILWVNYHQIELSKKKICYRDLYSNK